VTKVDEEKLVKMLEHDLQLADLITSLNSVTGRLAAPDVTAGELSTLLSEVEKFLSEYEVKLSEREDILAGFTR
jgi:hypothetical protein